MTDDRDFPFSTQGWLDAQRRYWDAWASVTRPAAGPGPGPSPDPGAGASGADPRGSAGAAPGAAPGAAWVEGLDTWWRTVAPGTPPGQRELYGWMVEQGKAFLRLGDEWMAVLQRAASAKSGKEWQSAVQARFDEMRAALTRDPPGVVNGPHGWMEPWQAPFDVWRHAFGGGTPGGAEATGAARADGKEPGNPIYEQLERILGFPALGYAREWQAQAQQLAILSLDYQRALEAYTRLFGRLGGATADGLQRRVTALAAEGKAVTSLRQLYDLWVDAAEEAYYDLVRGEAYSVAYGRLVNAMMAVKEQSRRILDDALDAQGLPTTRGLNTMQRHQHELRRQSAALRRRLDETDPGRLRQELEALRAEIGALRGGRPAGSRGRKAKKTVGRRRTTGAKETKP